MKILAGFVIASAVVAGCAKKDTDEAAESAKATTMAPAVDKLAAEAEIRALDTVYFNGVTAKNANALTSTYANDAISMPANAPTQVGHDAIQKGNEEFLKLPQAAMTGGTDMIKFSDDGTMAYATGKYHATWMDAKGKPVTDDGKYLNILQKVDGKWKIVADSYSGNAPPKM